MIYEVFILSKRIEDGNINFLSTLLFSKNKKINIHWRLWKWTLDFGPSAANVVAEEIVFISRFLWSGTYSIKLLIGRLIWLETLQGFSTMCRLLDKWLSSITSNHQLFFCFLFHCRWLKDFAVCGWCLKCVLFDIAQRYLLCLKTSCTKNCVCIFGHYVKFLTYNNSDSKCTSHVGRWNCWIRFKASAVIRGCGFI